jgi:BlaI family transcriptional regulator, penicillinase repressor
MARKKDDGHRLTPLELSLMQVLWEKGPSTVHEVKCFLAGKRDLAYTTVQTMLNLLHRKKKVRRALRNRAYVYEPILSQSEATRCAVDDVLEKLFDGSPDSLVMSLVANHRLTPKDLRRLQKIVESQEQE